MGHNSDLYEKLLVMKNEENDYLISKDINRTFPEVGLFEEPISSGKNKLFNVLKAYSVYDN